MRGGFWNTGSDSLHAHNQRRVRAESLTFRLGLSLRGTMIKPVFRFGAQTVNPDMLPRHHQALDARRGVLRDGFE
jgi:hypothetical protein